MESEFDYYNLQVQPILCADEIDVAILWLI